MSNSTDGDSLANVNQQDKRGRTALMFAAYWGYISCTEILVKAGANVTLKDKSGNTALHWSARSGKFKIVMLLVNIETDIINQTNNFGSSALQIASKERHFGAVKILVNVGANINLADNLGLTALHLAAIKGHLEIVEFLVKARANTSLKTVNGHTPINEAYLKKQTNIVKYLLNHTEVPVNPVLMQIEDMTEFALIMLEEEILIESEDIRRNMYWHDSILHRAVLENKFWHVKIISVALIRRGNSISEQDDDGNTPLHLALENNYTPIAIFLVKKIKISDHGLKNKNGYTVLDLAIKKNSSVVGLLKEHGADENDWTQWYVLIAVSFLILLAIISVSLQMKLL